MTAGAHGIRIPATALSEPTRITVTALAGPYVRLELTAANEPFFRFDRPVEVTISYARCRWPVELVATPSAWYLDEHTGALFEPMGGANDTRQRSVTFETTHLSTYAVAY